MSSEECLAVSTAPFEPPSHVTAINSLIVAITLILFANAFYFRRNRMPQGRKYDRLRVRPRSGQWAIGIGTAIGIIGGPVFELIGLQNISCLATMVMYCLGFTIVIGTTCRRAMIFAFKVQMSRLKYKKGILNAELLKKKRNLHRLLLAMQAFFFPVWLIAMYAIYTYRHFDAFYTYNCKGCEGQDSIDSLIYSMFFIGYDILILSMLFWVRDDNDVFAQFPEYRLLFIFGQVPLNLGVWFVYWNPNGAHTNFVFRGTWLNSFGYLSMFYVAVIHQDYLAVKEGMMIQYHGQDIISRLWRSIKRCFAMKKKQSFLINNQDLESIRSRYTLNDIMDQSELAEAFIRYTVSEYCTELVEFYVTATEYMKTFDTTTDEKKREKVEIIKKTFIEERSSREINISHILRQNTLQEINSGKYTQNLFNDVLREVTTLLNAGPLQRFKHTGLFKKLVQKKQDRLKSGTSKTALNQSVVVPVQQSP